MTVAANMFSKALSASMDASIRRSRLCPRGPGSPLFGHSNQRKHDGVSFEEARQVFRDPLHVSVQERIEGGGPRRERDDAMKTKLDIHNAETSSAMTDARREHLAELAAMPDETIDTSGIPELSDAAWSAGVRGRFYRPVKQQITARVNADVLDWLKSQGKGYQGRLNAILRREMLASLSRRAGRKDRAAAAGEGRALPVIRRSQPRRRGKRTL